MTRSLPAAPASDDLLLGLTETVRGVHALKHRWLDEHPGVPIGPALLLAALERHDPSGGCRLTDLAAATSLDTSTVSRETARLLAAGLLERRADPRDGRAARLVLTDEGRTTLHLMRSWTAAVLGEVLVAWDPAEAEAFARSLRRFAGDLDARLRGGGPLRRPGPPAPCAPVSSTPAPSTPAPSTLDPQETA